MTKTTETTMKTYRAYALDVTNPASPIALVLYVRAVDNACAWKQGRAALDANKRGKRVEETNGGVAVLFTDAACKDEFTRTGDALTFVKTDSQRVKNVKIDADALRAILADDATSLEDKVAAASALAGLTL